MVEIESLLVIASNSIRDVMACIEHNNKGIALVVDHERRLVGTVTDGDIRRAILAGINLDSSVQSLLERWSRELHHSSLTAPVGTPDVQLLHMMNENALRHIPLIDGSGRVVDMALLSYLVQEYELPLTAVVMGGGYGTRLRPLTEELPKPMLPVGDRPLIEHIVSQLREAGIRQVCITTHYRPESIVQHFGNGQKLGVEISYVNEELPLGTAGALGLMHPPTEPLLVINGDILTQVDFRAMLDFHREHHADLTVAVRQYNMQVPYGVIDCDGPSVRRVREKPLLNFLVNAGIYLLEPSVHRYIPSGKQFDMTELIQQLLEDKRSVVGFPIVEYWLDIGQHADYEQAQKDISDGRLLSRFAKEDNA